MKVYILVGGYDYEGYEVIDAFATEELAEAAKGEHEAGECRKHNYEIVPRDVIA